MSNSLKITANSLLVLKTESELPSGTEWIFFQYDAETVKLSCSTTPENLKRHREQLMMAGVEEWGEQYSDADGNWLGDAEREKKLVSRSLNELNQGEQFMYRLQPDDDFVHGPLGPWFSAGHFDGVERVMIHQRSWKRWLPQSTEVHVLDSKEIRHNFARA